MDKPRIQDDLYYHVNQEWLEQAVIPEDKPTTGGFADLAVEVEKNLIGDLNEMVASGNIPNEHLRYACRFYEAVKDVKARNKAGIRPALKKHNKILKLANMNAFNRNLKELVLSNYVLPFSIDVDCDMKDTNKHCVMLTGPSTILPDTTYYQQGKEQTHDMMIGLWSQMAAGILAKTRLSAEEQASFIQDAIKFDAIVAKLVKSSEEWADYPAMYNPMTTRRVASLLKPIKFRRLLQQLFGQAPERIIVADPRFLKGFSVLFNEENFELYKHWAFVKGLISSCSLLSEQLRDLGGSFSRALSGIAAMPNPEKHAYQTVSRIYSEPLGIFYGRKYFGEEAKADVVAMVKDIIATYKVRVQNNDFLSPETKEKAILKLSTIDIKMGYPDKPRPIYDKFVFEEGLSAYEIMQKLLRIDAEDRFSKLYEPFDRTQWGMPGHMVNACYNPFNNDICFPAAILQAPFYSIKQTKSQNLGGIGAVIGHEISHAFDNNGAQFDEMGNLKNWWTKEDFKKFGQKTKAMIKEFDGYELPWGKVNGTLVVSENIADNGGMAVTLEIMRNLKGANFEEYFTNWAKVWCMKAKPEYLSLLLSVDVHAPAYLRANMQPRNFDEWYSTFGVTKKDKMYLAPNRRVGIW